MRNVYSFIPSLDRSVQGKHTLLVPVKLSERIMTSHVENERQNEELTILVHQPTK